MRKFMIREREGERDRYDKITVIMKIYINRKGVLCVNF